eukprot:28516_1
MVLLLQRRFAPIAKDRFLMALDFTKLCNKQSLCHQCNLYFPNQNMVFWRRCQHSFCKDCVLKYIQYEIGKNERMPICCIETCHTEMSLDQLNLICHYFNDTSIKNEFQQMIWKQNHFQCSMCRSYHDRREMFDWTHCKHAYGRDCAMSVLRQIANKKGSVFEMNWKDLLPCCVVPRCNETMSLLDADRVGASVSDLAVLQYRLEKIEFINSHFKCCFCSKWHDNKDAYLWSNCSHKYTKSCIRKCLDQCIQKKDSMFDGWTNKVPVCRAKDCKQILKISDAAAIGANEYQIRKVWSMHKKYNNTYQDITAPRTPNWNNVDVNKNKHQLMQMVPQMNATVVAQSDQIFRYRAGTLRSVDDMVNEVHSAISKYPEVFDNTYFLYTSDHGFHSGQFGMGFDKRQLYENDIRIPFYMSGPGIEAGSASDTIVLNVDIAPTLVELATGSVPEIYDGRSFVPYLKDSGRSSSRQQQFLIEYYGEGGAEPVACGNGIHGFENQLCDSKNNTYRCARVINGTNNEVNGTIFCNFLCYDSNGHHPVECEKGTPQGDGEYYDLENDYFELNNVMNSLSDEVKKGYNDMIDSFMACAGQTECNKLREDTVQT